MFLRTIRSLVFAFFSINLCICHSLADSLVDRFRVEAPQGWKALRDFNLGLQGTITTQTVPVLGYPETIRCQTINTFRSHQGNLLHRFQYQSSQRTVDQFYGINEDYGFLLKGPRDKTGPPWTIGYLGRDKQRVLKGIGDYGETLFVSHEINGQDLAWTVAQRGFQVNSLTNVVEDERELVRLDFASSAYERKDYQIRGGTVLLDPSRHWAVRKYDLKVQLDALAEVFAKVDYGDDIAGFPVPRHYVLDFKAVDDVGALHRHITADYVLKRGMPTIRSFVSRPTVCRSRGSRRPRDGRPGSG